jgi:hypothetical protein
MKLHGFQELDWPWRQFQELPSPPLRQNRDPQLQMSPPLRATIATSKCAIGVSAGKFLGFIIHEHGIEIDPNRIRAIRNVGAPTCKLVLVKGKWP